MATGKRDNNQEFLDFLKSAPTLDEANAEDLTEISGIVSRTDDGKFAITTGEGHTYELETGAVRPFRAMEGSSFQKMATIQVVSEALKNATLRPIKPVFKDVTKDPIKDIILDGKHPPFDKHPSSETLTFKDVHTDPLADQKNMITDPIVDKRPWKDIHKDPIIDPPKRLVDEGTGPADVPIPDPTGPFGHPVGPTPFAMATPHHAPQHLLAMQAGAQPPPFPGGPSPKPLWEKHPWSEKIPWRDTVKETIFDTHKEMIMDTRKELIWDPPQTFVEGIPDPTGPFGGPQPDPWRGGMPGFGMQGF